MKFTVTPLGGGRGDAARVVDAIVRYLQPPPKATPTGQSPPLGGDGPERYYADRGEEPGRWLGRAAHDAGLTGMVLRPDFAAVLAGRDPHTDERLITAQGSAGRRPTLGSGAHTKVGADGEQLYDVADAAAVLGLSHREVGRMLDVGTAIALGTFAQGVGPQAPAGRRDETSRATSRRVSRFGRTSRSTSYAVSRWTSRWRCDQAVQPAGRFLPGALGRR